MTVKAVGPNANLLNLTPKYIGIKAHEDGNHLERVDLIKRKKSLLEKVGVVVKDPGASDSIFKLIVQTMALLQEVKPSAVAGKVGSLFGKGRAATAPFYLLKTITDAVHLNYQDCKSNGRKIVKTWLELIDAASVNWNIWSSLLLERSDKIVGDIGTFAGLGKDMLELVDLGVGVHETNQSISVNSAEGNPLVMTRLKEERGIQWAKIAAVVASFAVGVFAALSLVFGISVVPAVALLTIALLGTAIKVGTTFYEKTREMDLYDALELV